MSFTLSHLLIGILAGAVAGMVYFAALWVSVRGLTDADKAHRLVLGAVLRLGAVIGALWLAMAAGVSGLTALATIPGFILARTVVTRLVRPAAMKG